MIAAASIATGYVGYKVYRKNMLRGKTRRAKRAETGGRCDVVIIAGSPTLPLTRCLSLDLERKGFIIFIVCNTIEEEMIVQNLSRPDVRPLSIDVKDVGTCLLPAIRPGSLTANFDNNSRPGATRLSRGLHTLCKNLMLPYQRRNPRTLTSDLCS